MGIQSVELLLDEAGDTAIRNQWRALQEAGVPSLGAHGEPTRRPHITLTARQWIDDDGEEQLRTSLAALPIEVRVGAPMIFGNDARHLILVRSIVPTEALLGVQRAVHEALGDSDDVSPLSLPGVWSPHITLARLSVDHLHRALEVVLPLDVQPTRAVQARRWDGTAKREWLLLHPAG